jgi:predicted nucleic acid-binding Zn ribbon protein
MSLAKTCRRCGKTRPEGNWSPSQFAKPTGGWCKLCRAAYLREYRTPSRDPRWYPEVPDGQVFCGRCRTAKPEDQFYAKQKAKNWCKECFRDWHRERYVPKSGANDEPRECAQCGVTYQPKTRRPSKFCSRRCSELERKESGRGRNTYLLRTYGITAADYDRLLAKQGGGCALCGKKPEELTTGRYRTYLHVDHDHDSRRVRGLLCPDHNLLLGRFGDSVEMFRKVVAYLEAHASD